MMVIFVSQCEKKALKRTRRVLDSFANRIGSNTWQSIITEEGLNAVEKLLKKSASRSSAISCHWIRGKSRSQLLWVVGRKELFDSNGVVAVHYGVTKRFIGERENMVGKMYANTNGQMLDEHLFGVAILAKKLIEKTIPEDENLAKSVYVAGLWHDMGKIDIAFQSWVQKLNKKYVEIPQEGEHIDKPSGKFSWQKYPRHNEISLLLFEVFFKGNLNDDSLKRAKHTLFWHHAQVMRDKKNSIKSVVDIFNKMSDFADDYEDIYSKMSVVLDSVNSMAKQYEEGLENLSKVEKLQIHKLEESIEGEGLPPYKRYSSKENIAAYKHNISFNAKNTLARMALITADRLISTLLADTLHQHIKDKTLEHLLENILEKKSDLQGEIEKCLQRFQTKYVKSKRNEVQSKTAKELSDEALDIGVLNGPAGCGKTKIALEWALCTGATKIYWICPRVQVCEGIFSDLCSEEYLKNANIEIVTGEIKKSLKDAKIQETKEGEEFSCDIIITTIDQVVNSITTHKHITTFMDFMNAHVVFDEYHEYVTMQGFNLLFAELIEAKKLQQKEDETLPNTLLVSATPNPYFVSEFLGINKSNIIGIESFNTSLYKLEFIEFDEKNLLTNPLIQTEEQNTFVISNTAVQAQKSFIAHQESENAILFHSKFIKEDKERLFAGVYESFKKGGSKEYDILRSGPVVQASLNITCKKMISEMSHAENFLQRLGRLDRFGESKEVNLYKIAITKGLKEKKAKGSSANFLNELDSLLSANAWYVFLENRLTKETYTINELYKIYEDFYEDNSCLALIEEDIVSSLKKSVVMIELNVLDPKEFPKSKKSKQGGVKIKKNSLRGNSLFVQMARCKISNKMDVEIFNKYAYEDVKNAITFDVQSIEGYGDSSKNLLAFMAKKHHNIKEVKKAYKDAILKSEARDPQTPVYLSYTLEDLQKVNSQPHPSAQYYAEGIKQAIGVLSLEQFHKDN